MKRSMLLRGALVIGVALVAVPASVHAQPPLVFHQNFSDSLEDVDVCGINVDIVSKGVFTDRVYLDNDGDFVRFTSTASAMNTFTAENGKSVVVSNAGQFADLRPIIDEAAGTITFTVTFKGLPEKIQTAGGPVLLRDAGLISFVDTFDLETFELISSEVIIKGPHPEADSDFALFCDVITEALA